MVPVHHQIEAFCSEVALLLKQERERCGLSLNSLAQKAGLSRQTVTFIEQGERIPTIATLMRLSSALGVEPESIISRARERTQKADQPTKAKRGKRNPAGEG